MPQLYKSRDARLIEIDWDPVVTAADTPLVLNAATLGVNLEEYAMILALEGLDAANSIAIEVAVELGTPSVWYPSGITALTGSTEYLVDSAVLRDINRVGFAQVRLDPTASANDPGQVAVKIQLLSRGELLNRY